MPNRRASRKKGNATPAPVDTITSGWYVRKRRQASPDFDPATDRDNGAYLDSLGWVLFKKGDLKEAKKYLLEALKDLSPLALAVIPLEAFHNRSRIVFEVSILSSPFSLPC